MFKYLKVATLYTFVSTVANSIYVSNSDLVLFVEYEIHWVAASNDFQLTHWVVLFVNRWFAVHTFGLCILTHSTELGLTLDDIAESDN